MIQNIKYRIIFGEKYIYFFKSKLFKDTVDFRNSANRFFYTERLLR